MKKIFVSYSQADKGFAAKLQRGIENLGVSVYSDTDLTPGASWEIGLRKALEECDAVLYVAPAPETLGANNAFFEAGAARALGKRIITVLPKADESRISELPSDISRHQFLDASKKSPKELAKSVVTALEAA